MNMTTYRPASNSNSLLSHLFDNAFDGSWPRASEYANTTNWSPAVDIRETESAYIIRADVPGVSAKDIEITLENNVLSISGHREGEIKKDEDGYRRIERYSGRFARHFNLPDTADAEKVDANVKDGVLEVVLHKKEASKPRRIAVKG